jgi:ABA DEFICIENT 4-like
VAGPLFYASFLLVAPFWALMVLAPGWSWTRRIIGSPLIVAPLIIVYAVLVLSHLALIGPVLIRPTLDGVRELLGSPVGAAAGWAHFLAFDLFVGRWIYLDSRDRGMSPLVTAPVLVLTILAGPLGLGVYLAVRAARPTSPVPPPSRSDRTRPDRLPR